MGLLDALAGDVGKMLGGQQGAASSVLAEALGGIGGYQGVLNLLQQSGLGDRVGSWLSTNAANLPITQAELTAALVDERLQSLAQKFGVPMDQVATLLSQHLPAAVDQASPNGTLNTQ